MVWSSPQASLRPSLCGLPLHTPFCDPPREHEGFRALAGEWVGGAGMSCCALIWKMSWFSVCWGEVWRWPGPGTSGGGRGRLLEARIQLSSIHHGGQLFLCYCLSFWRRTEVQLVPLCCKARQEHSQKQDPWFWVFIPPLFFYLPFRTPRNFIVYTTFCHLSPPPLFIWRPFKPSEQLKEWTQSTLYPDSPNANILLHLFFFCQIIWK